MKTSRENPIRILLADDDEDDRSFFKDALNELKHPVHLQFAEDGFKLMRQLEDPLPVPHIIFLDLNMPGKTGKECLQEIRMLRRLSNTPVIIFSTSSSIRDVEETFHNGASLYIQKPSGFSLMTKVLQDVLSIDWDSRILKRDRSIFFYTVK